MLVRAKTLKGYKLQSLDGNIGSAKEFYFDDRYWAIRYLVANTGSWLTGRKVLISPHFLSGIDTASEAISVELNKAQMEASPSIDSDKPVSRQFEDTYYGYYGLPYYWGGPFMWGYYPNPVRDLSRPGGHAGTTDEWDSHLRSTHAVTGYHLLAREGEIGHVDDFVVDDETWAIRYLIVATTNFWSGKKVLISPRWIERVSWEERELVIDLPRETIKEAPEYTDGSLLTRDHEIRLYGYHNRPGYWVEDLLPAQVQPAMSSHPAGMHEASALFPGERL